MWFSSVLGRSTSTSKPTPRGRPALARPRKFVPALEALERRDTPSTTVLSVSPNPANVGQAVTLTATVTGFLITPGRGDPPVGTVTFFDGAISLGAPVKITPEFPTLQGVARFATSSLGVGAHTLTAKYSGESYTDNFLGKLTEGGSTSPGVLEVVNGPAADAAAVSVARVPVPGLRNAAVQLLKLRNTSGAAVEGPVYLVLHGLKRKVRLQGVSGLAQQHGKPGDPFLMLNMTLLPGAELTLGLLFSNPKHQPIRFTAQALAGPGAV